MHNNHDSSYKFLFSNPELVRDLILGFIPDPWLHGLDFTTLERVSGSYCWRQPKTDPPCRLKFDPGRVVEFESINCG